MATATVRNVGGRPKGARNKPKSKLRELHDSLMLLQKDALENISKSIKGKEVDKSTLDSSWKLITNLVSVNRAAVADESLQRDVNSDLDNQQSKPEQSDLPAGRRGHFSPTMLEVDSGE